MIGKRWAVTVVATATETLREERRFWTRRAELARLTDEMGLYDRTED